MDASAITMAPSPIFTSAYPCCWATKAPDKATKPFDNIKAITTIKFVFTPLARTMWALFPVARMLDPNSVPKNQYMNTTTPIAKTKPMSKVVKLFVGKYLEIERGK